MLLNQMFEIKYPVIQGAMANIATAEFAASVSNAGGLGVIGTGAMNVEQAREAIRKCRSLTDKPFGVNVMMMNPYTKELMEMIAEEKVALVTTGAGNPGVYMKMLKRERSPRLPGRAKRGDGYPHGAQRRRRPDRRGRRGWRTCR